jgi:hypothetical protein
MADNRVAGISSQHPAFYEIRVLGILDQIWCDFAEDTTLEVIRVDEQAVSVLRATMPDQAALAGLLEALFASNATVLSVEALQAA